LEADYSEEFVNGACVFTTVRDYDCVFTTADIRF